MTVKTLLVGEAWLSISFDIKGFDYFSRSTYHESIHHLQDALESDGIKTDYIPTHRAAAEFPTSVEDVSQYDSIVLSDIGYNTLALPPSTFDDLREVANRLQLIEDFVRVGGGLVMIGGYLSFTGFNGKANYKDTPVEAALPVTLQGYDDRVERADGATPRTISDHSIVESLPQEWPTILGYNRVTPDESAETLAMVGDDPLVVIGDHGDGRTAAFTTDCAPHWGTPEFTGWEYYNKFWPNLLRWVSGE